jgi:DNA repair photolyase
MHFFRKGEFMVKVGITERGDPGLDFSWVNKLLPANIIITKNLNNTMIEHLITNKDKVILHMTCTGLGATKVEPKVPNVNFTHKQIHKLIQSGFPVQQIVLRIDPIIPLKVVLKERVKKVLDLFKDTGIKRVRYSFLDMYPHVKERLINAGMNLPYETFCCPDYMKNNSLELLKQYEDIYEFEACAEDTPHKLGCISQKDFDILGIKEEAEPAGYQRKGCLCVAGKTELLNNKKKCPHGCLYCYWKG